MTLSKNIWEDGYWKKKKCDFYIWLSKLKLTAIMWVTMCKKVPVTTVSICIFFKYPSRQMAPHDNFHFYLILKSNKRFWTLLHNIASEIISTTAAQARLPYSSIRFYCSKGQFSLWRHLATYLLVVKSIDNNRCCTALIFGPPATPG